MQPHRGLLALLVVTAALQVAGEAIGIGSVFILLAAGRDAAVPEGTWLTEIARHASSLPVGSRIRLAAAALILFALFRASLQLAQTMASLQLRKHVQRTLQEAVFRRFSEMPLDAFLRERRGSLTALLDSFVRSVGALVLQAGQAAASIAVMVSYVVLALALSWRLTILSLLLLAPVSFLLRPAIAVRLRKASRKLHDNIRETQAAVQELLAGMKLVRVFGRENWSHATFAQHSQALLAQEYRASAIGGFARPLFNALNLSLLAAVLAVGSLFLPLSTHTVPALLGIFLVIAIRLMGPAGILTSLHTQVAQVAPMLHTLTETIGTTSPVAPSGGSIVFDSLCDSVRFLGVSFRYARDEPLVLDRLDFTIPRGHRVAVVGPSGAGKSTLVNLVSRLYDPTDGMIQVDGIDLRQLEITSWRRRVAVVTQDVFLFHATAMENLRFARADATDSQVIAACRLAQAHDFIAAMPDSYSTVLQDRGTRLSAGQRRRVALARALLLDAEVLVLDEATNDVDSRTEEAMMAGIAEYCRGRTLLIIAHRLSMVTQADRIYVLDRGRLVEDGTHEELMTRDGLYRRLFVAQQYEELRGAGVHGQGVLPRQTTGPIGDSP
ncbi:MAG: ABC transporter ATP-binding protein [Acidobacteriota bacterium]